MGKVPSRDDCFEVWPEPGLGDAVLLEFQRPISVDEFIGLEFGRLPDPTDEEIAAGQEIMDRIAVREREMGITARDYEA